MRDRQSSVLIVDDEPLNLELLEQELEVLGYEIYSVPGGTHALQAARENPPEVILLDIMMPDMDGIEVCRELKKSPDTRDIPVIFMTALSDVQNKVSAFDAGGVDYVTKPFQVEEVLARVRTHVELRRITRELQDRNRLLQQEIERHGRARQTIEVLKEEIQSELMFDEIVGTSPALQAALERVDRVAGTDAAVLIIGETGTGKELFARAIHDRSSRSSGPLIKVNCAALPMDLIESELFGHEAGAFTGATRQRPGRFELADTGTLFLDEVGELSPQAQAKLLRVLQEGELERVGGARTLKVDVRVIAATNKDLAEAVHQQTFRDDLYYRLNVFPIQVPSLRERDGDIALLARRFLLNAARKFGKHITDIEQGSLDALQNYGWPGNVRELQNVIDRAAILSNTELLEIHDVLDGARPPATPTGTLEEVETHYIWQVLEESHWVIEGERGAAKRLGLNPSTLRGRMRKLNIVKPG